MVNNVESITGMGSARANHKRRPKPTTSPTDRAPVSLKKMLLHVGTSPGSVLLVELFCYREDGVRVLEGAAGARDHLLPVF